MALVNLGEIFRLLNIVSRFLTRLRPRQLKPDQFPGGGGPFARPPSCSFLSLVGGNTAPPAIQETQEPPPTSYPPVPSGQQVSKLREFHHPRSSQTHTSLLLALSPSVIIPQHFLPTLLPQPPSPITLFLFSPSLCFAGPRPSLLPAKLPSGNTIQSGPSLKFLSY